MQAGLIERDRHDRAVAQPVGLVLELVDRLDPPGGAAIARREDVGERLAVDVGDPRLGQRHRHRPRLLPAPARVERRPRDRERRRVECRVGGATRRRRVERDLPRPARPPVRAEPHRVRPLGVRAGERVAAGRRHPPGGARPAHEQLAATGHVATGDRVDPARVETLARLVEPPERAAEHGARESVAARRGAVERRHLHSAGVLERQRRRGGARPRRPVARTEGEVHDRLTADRDREHPLGVVDRAAAQRGDVERPARVRRDAGRLAPRAQTRPRTAGTRPSRCTRRPPA